MTAQRFKVGIIGLQSGRSWAARAHIPALRALPESFEIVGVANTSLASAQKAAAEMGLPKAFAGVAELVAAPEVDIVIVTVKVPHRRAARKLRVRGDSEADDGLGPAADASPFSGSGRARGGHRAGTR